MQELGSGKCTTLTIDVWCHFNTVRVLRPINWIWTFFTGQRRSLRSMFEFFNFMSSGSLFGVPSSFWLCCLGTFWLDLDCWNELKINCCMPINFMTWAFHILCSVQCLGMFKFCILGASYVHIIIQNYTHANCSSDCYCRVLHMPSYLNRIS